MIIICEFIIEQWLKLVLDVCLSVFVLSNFKNPATKSTVLDILCIFFYMIRCRRNLNGLDTIMFICLSIYLFMSEQPDGSVLETA